MLLHTVHLEVQEVRLCLSTQLSRLHRIGTSAPARFCLVIMVRSPLTVPPWQLFPVCNSVIVARGSTVLAKSTDPPRIRSNLEIIELKQEDFKILEQYSEQVRIRGELTRYVYPPFGVDFGFPDKPPLS